jgi:hypothetical protein
MSDVLITPLMNLKNPVPSVDPGPDYANNLYYSFNILDQHNHSTGSGNQISQSGLDLVPAGTSLDSLPFNGGNATLLRSVRFSPQASTLALATDLNCAYVNGVDLYYNDGNGNVVQITKSGSVNATSSGISSGNASAAFSGSVLVVNGNTNTPGNIQAGSILIGDNTVGSNFVTVSAPSALAANYNFVLPAATPSAISFLQMDTSGNVSAVQPVSGPTFSGSVSIGSNLTVGGSITIDSGPILSNSAGELLLSSSLQIGGSSGPVLSYGSPGLSLNQQINLVSGSNSITIACGGANSILQVNGSINIVDAAVLGAYGGNANSFAIFNSVSESSGYPMVVSARPSTNGLFIVRGFVNGSGNSPGTGGSYGEGWTATRSNTGIFVISYSTTFQDSPVVTVTAAVGGNVASITSISSSSTTVEITENGSPINDGFYFIAIGQRNSSY